VALAGYRLADMLNAKYDPKDDAKPGQ